HIIIFNDGVKDIDRLKILIEVEYSIVDFPEEITIAQNRSFVLAYLKQSKFHYAIFGDSDDYFPSNRVEVNLDYLNSYNIVINDTHLVDYNGVSLMSKYFNLKNKEKIGFNKIKNKNCCGLGNTAIQINALPTNIDFNDNIAAVDWMLFSR